LVKWRKFYQALPPSRMHQSAMLCGMMRKKHNALLWT
jgi:hypothetical protein